MKSTLDYNTVNWNEHFYLSDTSPSGLRRVHNIYGGNGCIITTAHKDAVVGSKKFTRAGKPHSWRLTFNGSYYCVHRVIYVMKYGKIDPYLVIDHLDGNGFNNKIDNLCLKTIKQNAQNQAVRAGNRTGFAGVAYVKPMIQNSRQESWVSTWVGSDGRSFVKHFHVKEHGYEEAKQLAIDYRVLQISLLNKNGESYTLRHQGITQEDSSPSWREDTSYRIKPDETKDVLKDEISDIL